MIYPAFPLFYVTNPEYIRLLLEPVMQYLATGRWKQPYAIHDIGSSYPNDHPSSYPNALGHDDQIAEPQPVEECGNLLILFYAYSRSTNNTAFATRYHDILRTYADYLATNGINMPSQLSTDDGAGPIANQTNLAIKAAIGLVAYGTMFKEPRYTALGRYYANQLYTQGLATDAAKTHFTLTYPGNEDTYTTTFNLFPDALLQLKTFPQAAYDMQAAYYPTVRAQGGVPLDSRVGWAKSDWMLFAAAAAGPNHNAKRDMFIDDVHAFLTNGLNEVPFSDQWNVVAGEGNGQARGFRARPVVGGHFSVLAMQQGGAGGGGGSL